MRSRGSKKIQEICFLSDVTCKVWLGGGAPPGHDRPAQLPNEKQGRETQAKIPKRLPCQS